MESNNKLTTTELRAMLASITPGPWTQEFVLPRHSADGYWTVRQVPAEGLTVADVAESEGIDANARAIAQVPALIAEVLALREALANMLKQATFYRRCNEQARNLPDEEGPIERQARNALKGAK